MTRLTVTLTRSTWRTASTTTASSLSAPERTTRRHSVGAMSIPSRDWSTSGLPLPLPLPLKTLPKIPSRAHSPSMYSLSCWWYPPS